MSKLRYTSEVSDRPMRWIVEYFLLNVSYNFFILFYYFMFTIQILFEHLSSDSHLKSIVALNIDDHLIN